jgi:spoIIIJ-associated protein
LEYCGSMQAEELKSFISTFLGHLGLSYSDITVSQGQRTVVSVTSTEAEHLLSNKGEGLRSLQILARRMVEKQHGEDTAQFLIDLNNYHEQQMEQVRANARILAQRARLFKHEVEMEPMSSYERLVVHELFADDPEIETRSEGEGKFRHIVLAFRSK